MPDDVLFRTTDGAKWGAGKGTPLTKVEVDTNFWALLERIVALETAPSSAVGIANILVVGSQFKVVLTNAVELGPYTLPIATFHFREDWEPLTNYDALDVVVDPASGIYFVNYDHTSAATFDPNAVNGSLQPLYRKVFGNPETTDEVLITYPAIMHAAFGGI